MKANQAPQRAKRPCTIGSCKEYASNQGYCEQHQDKIKKKDRERGTSHQRGYDARWNKERLQHLDEHPLCVEHLKKDYIVPATVVDHIEPHKGDQELFWNHDNWQSLCKPCHDRKTATEDMGGWSPVVSQRKANRESKNPFKLNDRVLVASEYAQESFSCSEETIFIIIEIEQNTVFVRDLEGNGGRLHHSHFKRAELCIKLHSKK